MRSANPTFQQDPLFIPGWIVTVVGGNIMLMLLLFAVNSAAMMKSASSLGTRASGVMVDYDSAGASRVGYIAAHEIGHFLGLIHTTEQDGGHDLSRTWPWRGPTCTTAGSKRWRKSSSTTRRESRMVLPWTSDFATGKGTRSA